MNYAEEDMKIFNKYCKTHKYYPLILPARKDDEDIIVIGDIHGDFDLLIKCLRTAKVIDNNNQWIGGNTIIVQVGDQLDNCRPLDKKCEEDMDDTSSYSGSSPEDIRVFKFFNELDIQANKVGGMIISLIGNHELMNVMGNMSYVSYKDLKKFSNYKDINNPNLSFMSGKEARQHAFKPGNEYANLIACTRLPCVIIGSYLFVHAGIIKKFVEVLNIKGRDDLYKISYVLRKWLLGLIDKDNVINIINSKPYSLFWDRLLGSIPSNVSNDNPICVEHLNDVLNIFDVKTMFIGHTPQNFAHNSYINKTCGNGLYRLDCGSSYAFNKFDPTFKQTHNVSDLRKAQVLRIRGDNLEPEILKS